jgi:peptide/nickel transport system permease protein
LLNQQETFVATAEKKRKNGVFVKRIIANRMLFSGILVVLTMILISVVIPFVMKLDPYAIEPVNRLQPPSAAHWFGTDDFGRDLFTRVIYGLRYSLLVGFVVAVIVTAISLVFGLFSAYFLWIDNILMRVIDGLYAFPTILLAIAIVAIRGPSIENVMLALIIVYIPSLTRVIRSAALVIKEQTYIEALRLQGANIWRILFIHTVPNIMSPIIIQTTFIFASAILTEAALSFLGAGIPAPAPSLGNILYDGKNLIYKAWWMTVFPGIFVVLLVVSLNIAGDGLRDLLDPKTFSVKNRKKRLRKEMKG